VVRQRNLAPGKRGGVASLRTENAGKTGEIVFSVNCPYVTTAGELELTRSGTGKFSVAVSVDRGKTWKPVEVRAEGNAVTARFIEAVDGAFDGYWLKIGVPAGGAFANLKLKTHFQLNPYSLPHLVPGRNIVSVEAAGFGAPLTVTYNWAEGPGWASPRQVSRTFSQSGTFSVEVKGPKYPRMGSLRLSVAP